MTKFSYLYFIGTVILVIFRTNGIGQVNPPNIIFMMSDDHAQKAISAYNSSLIQTPNIDRLATEGAIFTNSFVANSICSPSRAVMLTGKHSHLNGVLGNQDVFDGSQQTLPKILQEHGYYTAMVGKWHLKSAPTGFDFWKILRGQGSYYGPAFISEHDTVTYNEYVTDVITDIAINVLDNREKNKPFFLVCNHKAPHRTWMPDTTDLYRFENVVFPLPENFYDDFEGRKALQASDMRVKDMLFSWDMKMLPGHYYQESKKGGASTQTSQWIETLAQVWLSQMTPGQRIAWDRYYVPRNNVLLVDSLRGNALAEWMYQRYMHDYLKCVVSVDRNVGKLLHYLKEADLLENTIIVYTSDQGFYLGEHGLYDKRFMYEESFRTPLLIRFPEEIKAGIRIDGMVQNIDYAPTLLDLAGIKIPEDMQGKSFRVLWNKDNAPWRNELYYHYYEFPDGHMVNKHNGIRTQRYKLIHFYEMDEWEMYDLKTDPMEMNNLIGKENYMHLYDSLKLKLLKLKEHYKVL